MASLGPHQAKVHLLPLSGAGLLTTALCSEVLKTPRMETSYLSQRSFPKLNYHPSEDFFFPNLHPEPPNLQDVVAALSTIPITKKSLTPPSL